MRQVGGGVVGREMRKSLGESPHATPGHPCEDNIKTDLKEIGEETVDWIVLVGGGLWCPR